MDLKLGKNSIKSVASDYNEFTSKELMSKSGSDTHEFDKYKPSMGFGNQNSTGGYNTLKSTLKSTTISSIPGMYYNNFIFILYKKKPKRQIQLLLKKPEYIKDWMILGMMIVI